MIVRRKDLHRPVNISLKGHEAWLSSIYASFPSPNGEPQPPLTGDLEVAQTTGDAAVRVHGQLHFAPYLDCSLCGEALRCPLKLSIDAIFRDQPSDLNHKKIHNLSPEELDQYYFGDNGAIDLEGVINDAIHLEIPDRPTCQSTNNAPCSVPAGATKQAIQNNESDERPHPFRVLANYKPGSDQ